MAVVLPIARNKLVLEPWRRPPACDRAIYEVAEASCIDYKTTLAADAALDLAVPRRPGEAAAAHALRAATEGAPEAMSREQAERALVEWGVAERKSVAIFFRDRRGRTRLAPWRLQVRPPPPPRTRAPRRAQPPVPCDEELHVHPDDVAAAAAAGMDCVPPRPPRLRRKFFVRVPSLSIM